MVRVVTQASKDQINILQPVLTYLDSKNLPVEVRFVRNRSQTNEFLQSQSSYDITALHFDFAKDYFIAPIPMNKIEGSFIHLEDEKGNVVQEKQAVDKNLVFDLHKNHGHNWSEFSQKFTPEPLEPFDHLTTIVAKNVRVPKNLLFELIDNKLNIKYDYSGRVIFENQKDLDEVIKVYSEQKIDFSKNRLVYQNFRGDCHMAVDLFQVLHPKAKTITIKAFDYDGGCRAGGSVSFLTVIPIPPKNMKMQFEKVNTSNYGYLIRN